MRRQRQRQDAGAAEHGGRGEEASPLFKELCGNDQLLQAHELYTATGSKLFRRLMAGSEGDDVDDDADAHDDDEL